MPQPHAMLRKFAARWREGKFLLSTLGGNASESLERTSLSHWFGNTAHGALPGLALPKRFEIVSVCVRNVRAAIGYTAGSLDALSSGWHIEELTTCYQGYCDLAVVDRTNGCLP